MFGGNSKFFADQTYTDVDAFVNDKVSYTFFSADFIVQLTIDGIKLAANRAFVYGWINSSRLYGWCIVMSFDSVYFGKRSNSSNFTWKKIA